VRVAAKGEGELGTRGVERWSCRGEVVRLEEAAAQGKAGQGSSPEAGLSCRRRVGSGRVGQQGEIRDLFIQLAFALKFLPSTYIFTEASQGSLLLLYFNK